jgi:uncharacterized protein (TIGR03437 family)
MCLRDTSVHFRQVNAHVVSRTARELALLCAFGLLITFSSPAQETVSAWRRVAGTSINEGLASPATGPVAAIWYAAGSNGLFAQTESGRVFETDDFVHWRLNTATAAQRGNPGSVVPLSLPEGGARVQAAGARLYAAGASNLYASDDTGRTWLNLTGYGERSVIGGGFTALAVSPANPRDVSAANQFGVWRSLDGGLSWVGLNEDLPNLMVRRLVGGRTVELADSTLVDVSAGFWTPVSGNDPELALRARLGADLHANVSAAAQSQAMVYGGTADGRIVVSRDNGATANDATAVAEAGISRIWVDADRPDVALAASGSRLFRTVNGGLFWDEVTGTLASGQIHGIAADRSAGVVYLATDRGVFAGNVPLNDAGAASGSWTSVGVNLPPAPAWDVALSQDNTLTVALDGYGVFESAAPHRSKSVRIVSGADLTDRPAAPGSLISVLGANVQLVKNQGLSWPVLASSDQSSQLQVPFEAAAGTFSLALEGANNRWTVPLTIKETSPAIFVDADGAPLILDAASGLVVDPKMAVYGGSTVQILATGLGKVTPDWPSGVPAPLDSPPSVQGNVRAFLDGRQIEVTRAVLAPNYVGYYLVELQIPAIVNRGANELRIVMNGEESNRVKLYLEPDSPVQ